MSRVLAAVAAAVAVAVLPLAALAVSSNPNDQFYRAGDQWALSGNASSTNAPQAWCASTGAGIVIADIDTGADFSHLDLAGRLIRGANFTSGNANPGPNPQPDNLPVDDDYGHGTLTAGIMVADTDNGIGIAAEAPGAKVLVVKVFSDKGGANGYSAYGSDVAAGIYWAVEHGARAINLSLGPTVPEVLPGLQGDPIPAAIQWAWNQDVAVAIAAGNGLADAGVTPPGQPASYTGLSGVALVVGAMGPTGGRASYSQSGVGVNIFAPGGDGSGAQGIVSTAMPQGATLGANFAAGPGGNYGSYNGTSFATPYATGTLALLLAKGLDAHAAHARILGTTKSVGGLPVVNAAAAVGGCAVSGGGGGYSGCCGGGTSSGSGGGQAPHPVAASSPVISPSGSPAAKLPAGADPASAQGASKAVIKAKSPGFPIWAIVLIAAVAVSGAGGGWYLRRRT